MNPVKNWSKIFSASDGSKRKEGEEEKSQLIPSKLWSAGWAL